MKKILKWIGIILIGLVVLGAVFWEEEGQETGTASQHEDQADANTEEKPVQEEEEAAPKEISESTKQEFLAWESEVLVVHKKADDAMNLYQQAVEGGKDIFSMYSDVNKIKDTVSDAQLEISRIDVPKSLSGEHQKILREAQSNLGTGLFSKTEGLKQILKLLDEQKPSYADKSKEEFEMAQSFMMSGITKIAQVKLELGIIETDEAKEE